MWKIEFDGDISSIHFVIAATASRGLTVSHLVQLCISVALQRNGLCSRYYLDVSCVDALARDVEPHSLSGSAVLLPTLRPSLLQQRKRGLFDFLRFAPKRAVGVSRSSARVVGEVVAVVVT